MGFCFHHFWICFSATHMYLQKVFIFNVEMHAKLLTELRLILQSPPWIVKSEDISVLFSGRWSCYMTHFWLNCGPEQCLRSVLYRNNKYSIENMARNDVFEKLIVKTNLNCSYCTFPVIQILVPACSVTVWFAILFIVLVLSPRLGFGLASVFVWILSRVLDVFCQRQYLDQRYNGLSALLD